MKHVIKPLEAEVRSVLNLINHYKERSKQSRARAQEALKQAAVHDQEAAEHDATVKQLGQQADSLNAVIATVKTL